MTGAQNFFRLYAPVICDPTPAQRNVEDFDFVSAVPHSNHHTGGGGQLAGKTMTVLPQFVFILHSNVCLGLSNPYISSALWRQRASENTAHYIPSCSEAWVKQWLQMTGALFIAYDALRMNIEFSATPKHPHSILFNLFPSTFPPHHYFFFPTSALFLLGESFYHLNHT